MDDHADFLISVRPKYANCIFAGAKTVELRKRRPHILPGARIWIYATAPEAALKGYAFLDRVVTAKPSTIWERFKNRAGISKQEFDRYFATSVVAHALVLSKINILENPILLQEIKKIVRGFHPPQFFCRLNGAVSELRLNARKHHRLEI